MLIMRAEWDYSTLELVRTKVQSLKKSLRNVEKKLREARDSLVVSEMRKALYLHNEVSSIGLLFEPLRIESLDRCETTLNCADFCTIDQNNNNNDFESLNSFTIAPGCKRDGGRRGLQNSKTEETVLHAGKGGLCERFALQQLTSKLQAARTKVDVITKRTAKLHERVQTADNKVFQVTFRIRESDDALKTLRGYLKEIHLRAANLQRRAKQRKECERKISILERKIELATNKAIEAENREGELETQVVELEDRLEVYDMKLHRAKKFLNRMSQASDSSPEPTENCSVTMVLRRASLSRQSSLKGTLSRQSSTASFKGCAPLIINQSSVDSCGEESDVFD